MYHDHSVALTSRNARAYAGAFCFTVCASLVADAALQLALSGLSVSRYGSGAPWWITAHVVERGRWVAFSALVWWIAPRVLRSAVGSENEGATLSPLPRDHEERTEAWRHAGLSAIAVPVLWVLATWIVSAARFTLVGSWSTDGLVFLSPGYYRGVLVEYAPWLMAGVAVLGVRRHL